MSIDASAIQPDHPLSEEVDQVESEVRTVVRLLVQCVATEQVVAEQQKLLAELEDYQAQCWTRDELRHRQRMRTLAATHAQQQTARAASSCRQRQPAARRANSCSATRAPSSDGGEPQQGALRSRQRAKIRTLSTQVDADFSALATRMQALSVGVQNGAVASAPVRSALSGGSGAGVASRSGSGLSTTSAISRRSSGEGRRRRALESGEHGSGADTCGATDLNLADLSFVEALLPSVPRRHALHIPVHPDHPHTRATPSSEAHRQAERLPCSFRHLCAASLSSRSSSPWCHTRSRTRACTTGCCSAASRCLPACRPPPLVKTWPVSAGVCAPGLIAGLLALRVA